MKKLCIVVVAFLVCSCGASAVRQADSPDVEHLSGNGKVVVTITDSAVIDPTNDRRSYYRIYIDKISFGRTNIGLESQRKKFATKIERNSHLLSIEKYVLDEKKGKYVKVNNISQPKPNFFYFDNSKKRTVEIFVVHSVDTHKTEYRIE